MKDGYKTRPEMQEELQAGSEAGSAEVPGYVALEPCEGCSKAPIDCHGVDKCPNAIIKGLKDGEHWVWPESDYGKAEIWKINDTYFLFSIPMYGGQPQFEDAFTPKMVEGMISLVEGWT